MNNIIAVTANSRFPLYDSHLSSAHIGKSSELHFSAFIKSSLVSEWVLGFLEANNGKKVGTSEQHWLVDSRCSSW